jgi:arsenate reductase (thioredoxin)
MHARNAIMPFALLMSLACSHRPAPSKETVLFLCPHGAAKSLIAATTFNRLAEEHGLAMSASAAATEEPYAEVPAAVAEFLESEGIDVSAFRARRVAASDLDAAARVVTIDCDPSTIPASAASIESWDDVPKVSENLHGSIAAIRRHVAELITEFTRERSAR